ncbi:MAG: type II toxin-antitoxin system VapC family toxin [Micrococcales bacterium]|nr:type II toxin-antitoxin system VapC family toxin [Micrococcales bacterium]
MITLDASCLIALLDGQDRHHKRATAIVAAGRPGEMQIHSINLAEVLVGAVRVGETARTLSSIEAMGITAYATADQEPLRLAEVRHQTGLKLPDCCALVAALAKGLTLATFDQDLAKAARQLGITVVD